MNEVQTTPVRVWDLPTRAFHWLLAACVVGSIVTAHLGGNAMAWHLRLGYAVLTLLVFRLLWGMVGEHWSRFANFTYAPATVVRYWRGRSRVDEHHDVGHNPLGALGVFALLGLLAMQVGSGLFADDEIATTGPLNKFVSDAAAHTLTRWHKNVGQWLIVALLLLHVGAIVFYGVVRQRSLLRPMFSGDKRLNVAAPASADDWRSRARASVLAAGCAALVAWVVRLGA